jgi:pimeloyl-ACP methyl ester carboxylesterase
MEPAKWRADALRRSDLGDTYRRFLPKIEGATSGQGRPDRAITQQGRRLKLDEETAAAGTELPPGAEERFASLEHGRVRYLQAGSGQPLILLHGLLGYSFSFRRNLAALGQQRRVLAMDQLGVGFSDRPPGLDCSMRAVAARTLAFIDQKAPGSFDLLGTSHGGAVAIWVAAALAARGDERLRRLILVAPANPWSPHGRILAPFLARPPVATALRSALPRASFTWGFFIRRMYGNPNKMPPGTVEGYSAALVRERSWEYGLGAIDSWREDLEELKSLLPRLADLPVLLVWGDADPAVYPESAEPLREYFRNCEYVSLPGVGHLPYEEAPADFNRAVLEFLQKSV